MAATDEQGTVLWRETCQPYGERVQKSPAASANDCWYTGHVLDAESGLPYAGARYYGPAIGRFMAVDPANFTEKNLHSFNRYNYGNNNSYKYVDPDGRSPLMAIPWVIGTGWALYESTRPVPLDAHGDAPLVQIPTLPGPVGPIGTGARLGKGLGERVARIISEHISGVRKNTALGLH